MPDHHAFAASLAGAFAGRFDIGAAVNARTVVSANELLKRHYNSLTCENEMKFESLQPEEGRFAFEDADKIAAFARANGMRMRGHTLVWHNQTPAWVFEQEDGSPAGRELLLSRMKAHIDTVVKRYKDDIYCWDVVNEAVTDDGAEWLRPSKWLAGIGEDFIAEAFRMAHEADPKALLFYNDYNESNPGKRDRIIRLVKSLLEQDVPVHGIGLQAHWGPNDPTIDQVREAIERYAALGLQLQLTELDVSMFDFEDRRADLSEPTQAMLEMQAERYGRMFEVLTEYQAHITAVTFWGAADDYTWLDHFPVRGRKNWPMPFDLQHRPKPAFDRLMEVAAGAGRG